MTMKKESLIWKEKISTWRIFVILAILLGTLNLQAQSQGITINGVITDQTGDPLIGATVSEKGTTNAVMTNIEGKFSLQVSSGQTPLEIRYIGYHTQTVELNNRTEVKIILVEDTKTLDEVVVVGYGTQKKATLTGAVSAVNNAEIITTKNENIQNMLTGKLPGIRVVQKSSEPGEFNNTFDIRGMGSPLIIVDGVPRDNFNRLDANDVESISVLKDASAAIYGVRAANGVVLITTKKGQSGALNVEYAGNFGWQNPTGSPKSVSAADWMVLKNEKSMHDVNGGNRPYSQAEIDDYRNGVKRGTNWWGEIMDDFAPQTQHSVSIMGGSDKIQTYISLGYLNQESFFRSNSLDYQKYNLRSNISANITNRLKVEMNISGITDKKRQPYEGTDWIIRAFQRAAAVQPVYANGNRDYLANGYIDAANPVAMMNSDLVGRRQYENKWFQSSMTVSYDIPYVEGLTAKAMYSYDYQNVDNFIQRLQYDLYEYEELTDYYRPVPHQSPGEVRRESQSKRTTQYQFSLNYDRTFLESHHVTALGVIEGSRRDGDGFWGQRELALNSSLLSSGVPSTQRAGSDWIYDNTRLSYIGKLAYDFESKYMAEFTIRADGSSFFPSGNRWGYFPSTSVGWRISEENFWKDSPLNFVNNFKIRASYGRLGDDEDAKAYQFYSGFYYPAGGDNNRLPGGYYFGDDFILASTNKGIVNPGITWYTAKTYNFGIDVEAWDGLFGGSLDLFKRKRSDVLATRAESLPSVVGADLPQENLNSDENRGLELELTHRNRIDKVGYNLKGIFTFTRYKKRHVEQAKYGNSYENWRNNNNNRYQNVHWGYDSNGRFTSYNQIANSPVYYDRGTLPGDYIYLDWNGDGVINHLDVHPIAFEDSKSPFINFSFSIGAEWNGFDLDMLFQGSALSNVKYIEQLREPMWGHDYANAFRYFMNRWRPTDPTVDPYDHTTQWIAGKYAYTGSLPDENSKFNMHNASYLRLKSMEIGYTLPRKITSKVGIQNTRFYVNGYNLITWKHVELDPEHPNDSWGNIYPLNRTFSVGVNVKF